MLATPSIVRAAELRSQDFLAQAERERQIDAALATSQATRPAPAQTGTPVILLSTALQRLAALFLNRRIPSAAHFGW